MEYQLKVSNIKAAISLGLITKMEGAIMFREASGEYIRGEDCQVRIVGVCNGDPETTVFAHLGGGGMGMKSHDIHGSYCCSACHDVIDGRAGSHLTGYEIKADFHSGMVRTQLILIEKGLIKV